MYIENLRIRSFGKLENTDVELSPGVNLIEGANESGKSTIAAFIRFIFYGVPAKERQTIVSWMTGRAEGSMTVNTGNKRYRIERTLFQAGEKSAVFFVPLMLPLAVVSASPPAVFPQEASEIRVAEAASAAVNTVKNLFIFMVVFLSLFAFLFFFRYSYLL